MRSSNYMWFQMIHNIERAWKKRGVVDGKNELEWEDYLEFRYDAWLFVNGRKKF